MQNEEHFLKLIDQHFPNNSHLLKLNRGDDCAVLAGTENYCISSDLFLEDIHFRRSYFSPADVGYKALAVNISDIAAMGVKPVAFTMDLMAPSNIKREYWDEFFKSMSILARQNDMVLAGGDISRSEKIGVSITIFGVPTGSGRFISRGNCNTGDLLFIVGDIGLARAGLLTLESIGRTGREMFPAAVMAHLRPKPKVMIGTLLNAAGTKSLMDISDGLARDLPRLLGPNRGANIKLSKDDLNNNVVEYAQSIGADPIEFAMLGGEDYALLGATDEDNLEKTLSIPGVQIIGKVTEASAITLNGQQFRAQGFDHFSD